MNLKHIFLPWLIIRELELANAELTGRVGYEQSTVNFLNEENVALRAANERLFDRVGVLERRLAPFTVKRKRDARGHFLREVA